MADPLSVTSAVVGLITASCQASKALRDTIHSYRYHTKNVRDLRNELEALEGTLQVLDATLASLNSDDFAALELPLRRCGCACEEFKQSLERCAGRNDDDKSKFRGWLKIRWMNSDINGFKDTLAGYKSTIAIAIAGVNLRTTKVSLDVIREYKGLIQSTTTDLQDHLHTINEEMQLTSVAQAYEDNAIDEGDMQSERDCTIRCLEICTRVATVIEEHHFLIDGSNFDSPRPDGQATSGNDPMTPQNIVKDSLQSCRSDIRSANAQLLDRLQHLSARICQVSANPLRTNLTEPPEHRRMAEEIESIRQCLNICMQASEEAEKVRANIMEDVATAEDSRQVLVSTVGDLIAAHRVTAGARSLQCIGQMSDETLQLMSNTLPPLEVASTSKETRTSSDEQKQFGRTLGSKNVRTL